jgi:ferrous iron transport protein B
MGGVIMVASVLIWALGHYPVNVQYSRDFEKEKAQLGTDEKAVQEINALMHSEHQENSYIGRIGKSIEPLIRPLGFDWKMGISLLTGVAAKEIVVSTMGVIYQAEEPGTLKQNIRAAKYTDGSRAGTTVFTPLATLSCLLFTMIYFPCVATIAAIFKESGSWKWAMFTVFYTTGLAWLISFAVFQTGSILF